MGTYFMRTSTVRRQRRGEAIYARPPACISAHTLLTGEIRKMPTAGNLLGPHGRGAPAYRAAEAHRSRGGRGRRVNGGGGPLPRSHGSLQERQEDGTGRLPLCPPPPRGTLRVSSAMPLT